MSEERQRNDIAAALAQLSPEKLDLVATVVERLSRPVEITVKDASSVFSNDFAGRFADTLQIHHAFSTDSFTKDKFEHAMCYVLNQCGTAAELAPRGNPGHDMTVEGERWSLKTQADRSIRMDSLHISKFMELGRGQWEDESHLPGLRDSMFRHMGSYDRILSLRSIPQGDQRYYELVEIPKDLLFEAEHGEFEMRHQSRQQPKPGYCTVYDSNRNIKFQLYFDGGTERKLQIKNLSKSHCIVQATWSFSRD